MPSERARALRWAGEMLREVQSRDDVPADLKRQAYVILRHYPSSGDIDFQARMPSIQFWLGPEDDLNRR
jgi:hypothetical protein